MQKKGIASKRYGARVARVVLKTILFLLLFVVFVFILLLTPPAQKFLTARVQHYLEKKLHTKVLIGRIAFGLSGKINLKNVYIEDLSKDTLLYGGSIRGHINYAKLFSNEVKVNDIEFQDITAKIKRVLPDTTFNFQFLADAFISENSKQPDTARTAPMKLDINKVTLENVSVHYTDVIAGSEMIAHVGELTTTIDSFDPYSQHFAFPKLLLRNSYASIKQVKPLANPKPLEQHIAEAVTPSPFQLDFGSIDISNIDFSYGNDVSTVYATAKIGSLTAKEKNFDLQNNRIELDKFGLDQSTITIRLGKTQQAQIVKEEVNKEAEAQKQADFALNIGHFVSNDNSFQFDDDNKPHQRQGIDYAHLLATNFSLETDNFILNKDSIGGNIRKGSANEKSGFRLEQLQGDVLYANNQSYVHHLYIKTPGTELKKDIELNYSSFEALVRHFDQSSIHLELDQSRLQVKDLLSFAPALRHNAAFRDPNDVWAINIRGAGTVNQFSFETLQFTGFSNTQIDAHGSLTGLNDPKNAGGNFVINRLHTNQNDIALFTGQKLSTQLVNLPQEFTANGTINGNAGVLNTKLNISTSDGSASINGKIGNLTDPSLISYVGTITTNNLQLGKILDQSNTIGSLSAVVQVNGKGLTTNSIDTKFSADIASIGLNNYQYRNVKLNGSLLKTNFDVATNIKDPNLDADFLAKGNFSGNPSFSINGMIDSLKTMPLHLTTEPLIARGKIEGTASNINSENVTADILVTQSLFVLRNDRLAMDTIRVVSGVDTANYLRLQSTIATASITGHYRLTDLGDIIQNSIEPYFTTASTTKKPTPQSYNFNFVADVNYHPILSAFVPGLTDMKTLHASGNFSAGSGMNAMMTIPYIVYQGNTISNLGITANSATDGLKVKGRIVHLVNGNTYNVYNIRLDATALNNNIDFSLGIDDKNAKNKYFIAGLLTQPASGTYNLQLKPGNLLLNYQPWTINAGNRIIISPDNISASNFVLQNGRQQLSINSPDQHQQMLLINFTDFQLATITGFIKADSVLADGRMNGSLKLGNYMKQPNFTGDLTVNDLSFRNDTIGNVVLHATNAGNNRYNVETNITGKGNDIAFTGSFTTLEKDIDLNLDMKVRALQLHTMEGPFSSVLKNASGAVNGNVAIRGSINDPKIQGDLNFNKTSFALVPLGSLYFVDGQKLSVTNNGFAFNRFTIKDSSGNALVLDGNVVTSNFSNYMFGLSLTATNFQLLNAARKNNSIYYGRLNISSDLFISGTEKKPVVDGQVTVNKGTDLTFVVPQEEPGIASRDGIVEFVDMSNPANDSLFKRYDSLNIASVTGLDIAVNIEVKKEAMFNIVVDAANGDFINMQGEALLTTGIDPSGKITLTGSYVLDKGYYELTFNFLKRKFEINKGSTITWMGEPTSASLNVEAVYVANAAPIDLVKNQIEGSAAAIRNTYMQRLPFELHLNLTGELLKPVIDFDIKLPENKNYGVANDVVTTVQYRLAQLEEDEGETNKQVFSLLLMNRFVGENPLQSESGFNLTSYARQSASKLLTEQLNQLAAGLINGVDINFDVTSTEDYTTGALRERTDLNLSVSKKLMNDRLKISVGNNFELEGPQHTNQQNNNIAGNIAVDYQLSKDGRYLIRYYRKNDYEGEIDGYVIEDGLSFIITVDYDRFKELLHRRKQKITNPDNTQKSIAQ